MRPTAALALLVACASPPPNTCDQYTANDIAWFGGYLAIRANAHSRPWQVSCSRGGSATADIINAAGLWDGSIELDGCVLDGTTDLLTVTGTVTMQGDLINNVDSGSAAALTMRGTVPGCAMPVDETCDVSWDWTLDEYGNPSSERAGTLCGRHFP